jgi:hypothetical protein
MPAVILGPIGVSGDFAINSTQGTCASGASLTANASCAVDLTFTPTALGLRTGTLTFVNNAYNGPQVVTLSGKGIQGKLAPASIAFGKVTIRTVKDLTVTLRNRNRAPLEITGVRSGLSDFQPAQTCVGPLSAQASCSFTIEFKPSGPGPKRTTLLIDDDAVHNPQAIAMTGSGIAPVLTRTPASLDFGRVPIGSMPTLHVKLANHSPLAIRAVAVTSDNPALIPAPTCVGTLMPGRIARLPRASRRRLPARSRVGLASSITQPAARRS